MKISNKTYDLLCLIAKIIAPFATFVSAILTIWGLPYAQQITATFAAVDVFMGALVTILKAQYDKENRNG
jgi:hypothetical protein